MCNSNRFQRGDQNKTACKRNVPFFKTLIHGNGRLICADLSKEIAVRPFFEQLVFAITHFCLDMRNTLNIAICSSGHLSFPLLYYMSLNTN